MQLACPGHPLIVTWSVPRPLHGGQCFNGVPPSCDGRSSAVRRALLHPRLRKLLGENSRDRAGHGGRGERCATPQTEPTAVTASHSTSVVVGIDRLANPSTDDGPCQRLKSADEGRHGA